MNISNPNLLIPQAISKSFGRINNYTINPSQEMIAIGITNIIGPFFGGYPATGSFSRTAIKSKAGVRTPFAGVITGIVVLLAIYLLTAVFYYIPNSSLSAVIIHAVGDLITPPNTVYKFWLVSPLEVLIFFAGVFVTIFTSIENGIYVTVAASAVVLLFRTAKAQGNFLGRVKIHSIVGDQLIVDDSSRYADDGLYKVPSESSKRSSGSKVNAAIGSDSSRNVFLPLDRRDGRNPGIEVVSPYPGVFIYRFSEGMSPFLDYYYVKKKILTSLMQGSFMPTPHTTPSTSSHTSSRPHAPPTLCSTPTPVTVPGTTLVPSAARLATRTQVPTPDRFSRASSSTSVQSTTSTLHLFRTSSTYATSLTATQHPRRSSGTLLPSTTGGRSALWLPQGSGTRPRSAAQTGRTGPRCSRWHT